MEQQKPEHAPMAVFKEKFILKQDGTSPVEVASSIPDWSVPQILTGKLQAQLPVRVTTKAKNSQYFEYDRTQKQTTKTTPPQQ